MMIKSNEALTAAKARNNERSLKEPCEDVVKEITRKWLEDNDWEIHGRPVQKAQAITGKTQTGNPIKIDNGTFLRLEDKVIVGADFSNLDLKFAVFKGCDLSSVKFNRCNLFKATFLDCILYNATFKGATLTDVKFSESKLFGIRLRGAEIHGLGHRGITNLISREFWPKDNSLAFRGTAGLEEWNETYKNKKSDSPNGLAFKEMNDGLPSDSIESIKSGKIIIPGVNYAEIIELLPLFDDVVKKRLWERDGEEYDDHFLSNIPNPPWDAFPEDSTGMMLRGFRKCFEEQGNIYPASEFRFWETTYLTASKWRVLQSKSFHADDGQDHGFRKFCGYIFAFVAWSLLYNKDERRKFGKTGREEKKKSCRWFDGGGKTGFLLHVMMLYALVAVGLWGFWCGTAYGIAVIIIESSVFAIITCFLFTRKDTNKLDSKIRKKQQRGVSCDALSDIWNALLEFVQHTTCGHGERPIRTLVALCIWIAIFGCFYSTMDLSYNSKKLDRVLTASDKKHSSTDIFQNKWSALEKGMYFSLISATTVGFGDITPATRRQGRLVCIEIIGTIMLTGIFLASLTRRFIGR